MWVDFYAGFASLTLLYISFLTSRYTIDLMLLLLFTGTPGLKGFILCR
jgi:hypothetical protein